MREEKWQWLEGERNCTESGEGLEVEVEEGVGRRGSLTWRASQKQTNKTKAKLMIQRKQQWLPWGRGFGGWVKWMKGVKTYTLSVIK